MACSMRLCQTCTEVYSRLGKEKSTPHVDGIVGSTQSKVTDLVTNQMQNLAIQQPAVGLAPGSTTPTTQSSDVHFVHSKTQKGPQHPGDKKIKGKKGGGGNNKKYDKNVEREKDEKRKVKFPCNICGDDHLTHQFPQMEESQCLMKLKQQQQQPVVLNNPFPQGKNLQGGSSNSNQQGGTSNAP
jgi:hypothetical protein